MNPNSEGSPVAMPTDQLRAATSETPRGGQAQRRRRRHRLFGVLTAVLFLAGQEILFRGLFPLPEVLGFNRIHYQMLTFGNPNLSAGFKRGLVYDRLLLESQPDGFSEIHDLNLYGFRGQDFAIDPPGDCRRILVIGDSVVEGQGAPESSTIAAELARLTAGDGSPAEVINLGVIAASLHHLTPLVRDAVGLLKPREVVLVLYANDLPVPAYPPELDLPSPKFRRREEPRWFPRAAVLIKRLVQNKPIHRRWLHSPIRFFAPVPDPSNPWTRSPGPPREVDPTIYRAMVAGTLNPWLKEQSEAIPGMLAHDFNQGGTPVRYLERMLEFCMAADVRLVVAYVPFCGTVHLRYAPALVKLGMRPATAEALSWDPIYRRQNQHLAQLCSMLRLPLADSTEDLVRMEAAGTPQYWSFDTHPRPAGYATIARRIHHALRRDHQSH